MTRLVPVARRVGSACVFVAMAVVIIAMAVMTVFVVGMAPVAGQTAPSFDVEIIDIDTSEHPTVRITVASVDLPRDGLPDGAVVVREAGALVPVSVVAVPGEDIRVVIALDTSGSMEGAAWIAAQRAAIEFIEQLPDGVSIATISFGDSARITSEFSTERGSAIAAIGDMEIGGFTSLYDAAHLASGLASGTRASSYVVLLSDGADTASETTLDEAATALGSAGMTTYAVSLVTEGSDVASLATLAEGRVIEAQNIDELSAVYAGLAARLGNQYIVEYQSRSSGPTGIQIEIADGGRNYRESRRVTLPGASVVVEPVTDEPRPSVPPTSEPLGSRSDVVVALPHFDEPGSLIAPPPEGVQRSWTLLAGVAAMAAAMGALLIVLMTTSTPDRPRSEVAVVRPDTGSQVRDALATMAAAVDRMMQGREGSRGLNQLLERAGSPLRLGEFVVGSLTVAAVAGLVGLAVGGIVAGILLAVLSLVAARVALVTMAKRRLGAFADQLGGTLQLMATALRTGHGLLQTVNAVSREAESPTREEFHRVTAENRLGRDLVQSLDAMGERMENKDFQWIVQAISIQRDVGGDLAEILDNVARTIAERDRIRRQVDALSADGRISARVLMALPVAAAVMFSLIQPGYLDTLFGELSGQIMLGSAAVLMAVGALWLNRIVDLEF